MKNNALYVSAYLMGVCHWIAFVFLIFPTGDGTVIHNVGPKYSGGTLIFENGGERGLLEKNILTWLSVRAFDMHDWYRELGYHDVVQRAIDERTMPYHVFIENEASRANGRFFSHPIWTMSPHVLLMSVMPAIYFFSFNLYVRMGYKEWLWNFIRAG